MTDWATLRDWALDPIHPSFAPINVACRGARQKSWPKIEQIFSE